MSFPKMAVRNGMLFPVACSCRDGGRHGFSQRPSGQGSQAQAKSRSFGESRLGNFFSESVTRSHRVKCDVSCVSAVISNQPTRRAVGNPCCCRAYYYL